MKHLLIVAALLLGLLAPTRAEEVPPLPKPDAARIMEAMEWREVTVIAIRQGVDAKGAVAPIYATIVGVGRYKGDHRSICETVLFDKELGWYALELGQKGARVWTREGYREIKPWSTW